MGQPDLDGLTEGRDLSAVSHTLRLMVAVERASGFPGTMMRDESSRRDHPSRAAEGPSSDTNQPDSEGTGRSEESTRGGCRYGRDQEVCSPTEASEYTGTSEHGEVGCRILSTSSCISGQDASPELELSRGPDPVRLTVTALAGLTRLLRGLDARCQAPPALPPPTLEPRNRAGREENLRALGPEDAPSPTARSEDPPETDRS